MDYLTHHGLSIGIHGAKSVKNGIIYPFHGVLTSFVMVPGLIASNYGPVGPKLTVFLIFQLVLYIIFLVLKELNYEIELITLTILFLLSTATVLVYNVVIYSELLQTLFYLLAILFGLKYLKNTDSFYLFLISFSLGLNIYVHFKTSLFALLFLVSFIGLNFIKNKVTFKKLFKIKLPFKDILSLVVPILIIYISYIALMYKWFGSFRIDALVSQSGTNEAVKTIGNPIVNLTASIFDF